MTTGDTKLSSSQEIAKRRFLLAKKWSTVVCNKWKVKREVMVITNMHNPIMVEVKNRRGQMKIKPNIIADYNQGMSGIDFSDQMLSYNTSLRKTKRWYKKMGVHFFVIFLHNSFRLFLESKRYESDKIKSIMFRERIISWLLSWSVTPHAAVIPNFNTISNAFHQQEKRRIHQNHVNGKNVVMKKGDERRRATRYFRACVIKPELCIQPCFKE